MQRLTVELSTIPPAGISRRYTSTGTDLGIVDPGCTVVQPVEIECQFYKVTHEVVVQGRLQSAICLTCSRCAEEFEQPLCVVLDAVYLRWMSCPLREQKSLKRERLTSMPMRTR